MTQTLPGFESIRRTWDPNFKRMVAKIQPGEYFVTVGDELIATTLGSCVSACIRCPHAGVGGMNHFMLPQGRGGAGDHWGGTQVSMATRYGNYAMEHLINDVLKHGGTRVCLEIKIVGGGQVLAQMTDIGRRNIEFVREYLMEEGLRADSEDVGDIYPRKVYYDPKTGKVRVKKLRSQHQREVVESEMRYQRSLKEQPVGGEVELFG
jgi:chemotaxis protein CheD